MKLMGPVPSRVTCAGRLLDSHVVFPSALAAAGYSEASLEIKKYTNFSSGLFSGEIDWRTENPLSKGGFANFRTAPSVRPLDLSDFSGLEMRVKTDGRP